MDAARKPHCVDGREKVRPMLAREWELDTAAVVYRGAKLVFHGRDEPCKRCQSSVAVRFRRPTREPPERLGRSTPRGSNFGSRPNFGNLWKKGVFRVIDQDTGIRLHTYIKHI